jgi:glutaminyl-peptide cyclotransferase
MTKNNMALYLIWIILFVFNGCGWFTKTPAFDADHGFQYLEKQCSFGPRNPGSRGHQECLDYITAELKKSCDNVSLQTFSYTDKRDTSKKFTGTNIIASINLQPKNKKRVMLCAHWDTRPWADRDPDPDNHDKPILGANDGASGVAVLLEITRSIKTQPLDIGVDIVLFDLEDYGEHGSDLFPDSLNGFCIGSKYFATQNKNYWPTYGILLDMIGDKQLDLPIEGTSYQKAKPVVNKVWETAKKLQKPAFRMAVEEYVYDDHIPLLDIGIPCIDIIDFSYPDDRNSYWHTMQDTPDKCSAESLKQIGDVLLNVLYNE